MGLSISVLYLVFSLNSNITLPCSSCFLLHALVCVLLKASIFRPLASRFGLCRLYQSRLSFILLVIIMTWWRREREPFF